MGWDGGTGEKGRRGGGMHTARVGRAQLCVCVCARPHDGAGKVLCMGAGSCRHDAEAGVTMARHGLLQARGQDQGGMASAVVWWP